MDTPAYSRLDLVPAQVRSEDGSVGPWPLARLFVGDASAHVFVDGPDGRVVEAWSGGLDDFSGSPVEGYRVEASDGTVLVSTRATRCLCGSRLRGYRPFGGGIPHRG